MSTRIVPLIAACLLGGSTLPATAQRTYTDHAQASGVVRRSTKVETSGGAKATGARSATGRSGTGVARVSGTAGTAGTAVTAGAQAQAGAIGSLATVSGTSATASTPYDIGVIPGSSGCPSGMPVVSVKFDSENDDNENTSYGWTGNIFQNNDYTEFKFCRVNGSLFSRMPTGPYAVVRLGAYCPAESVEFSGYYDTEDDGNHDSYSSSNGQPFQLDAGGTYIVIYYCLFPAGYDPNASFPNLGMQYGVFAGSSMTTGVLDTGHVHDDSEDYHNNNTFYGPGFLASMIPQIMTGGRNMDLYIARVK